TAPIAADSAKPVRKPRKAKRRRFRPADRRKISGNEESIDSSIGPTSIDPVIASRVQLFHTNLGNGYLVESYMQTRNTTSRTIKGLGRSPCVVRGLPTSGATDVGSGRVHSRRGWQTFDTPRRVCALGGSGGHLPIPFLGA